MKIRLFTLTLIRSKSRGAILLGTSALFLTLALSSAVAQLKTPKRITSLQLGDGTEGAIVSIVAESALSDYEAFRRGNRFYVRIPAAEFLPAAPGFRADGFDDVQVQKVGDSVVVSFKLQPGASARVDLHSNRLAVIFASPSRIAKRNSQSASAGVASTYNRTQHPSSPQNRQLDAGPMPPGSPTSGDRLVSQSEDPWRDLPYQPVQAYRDSSRRSANNHVAIAIASPAASPTPSTSIGTSSSYPSATTTSTPVSVATPSTAFSQTAQPASSNVSTRLSRARQWISANRLSSIIIALVLLNVGLFIALAIYRRRSAMRSAKNDRESLAQPKPANEVFDQSTFTPPPVATASASSNEIVDADKYEGGAPMVAPTRQPITSATVDKPKQSLTPERSAARSAGKKAANYRDERSSARTIQRGCLRDRRHSLGIFANRSFLGRHER